MPTPKETPETMPGSTRRTALILRIYHQQQGGHIHCRVFTGKAADGTFAKCGDLVFTDREWPVIKFALGWNSAQRSLLVDYREEAP